MRPCIDNQSTHRAILRPVASDPKAELDRLIAATEEDLRRLKSARAALDSARRRRRPPRRAAK